MPANVYFAPLRKEYRITLRESQYFLLKNSIRTCEKFIFHRYAFIYIVFFLVANGKGEWYNQIAELNGSGYRENLQRCEDAEKI